MNSGSYKSRCFLLISIYQLFECIVCLAANGYVYEAFGISKHFPIKLQLLSIRAETLDKPLTAKCFIYDVVFSCFFRRTSPATADVPTAQNVSIIEVNPSLNRSEEHTSE